VTPHLGLLPLDLFFTLIDELAQQIEVVERHHVDLTRWDT
jgi:hypothetical protein